MRVLAVYADPGIPLDGTKGASVHARQTVSGLLRRGVEITVLAARRPDRWDLPCRLLAPRSGRVPLRGLGSALGWELDVLAFSRDLADLVPFGPGKVDVVYERYALWSLAGALLAERLRTPLVVEVNAPLPDEQARWRGLALAEVAYGIERFLLRRADRVVCVSSALVERAAAIRGSRRGVELLPNAVDIDRFHPPRGGPGREVRSDGPVVAFVGSFRPWHGLADLVQAFALLVRDVPTARLVLAGDGPERERLERLADTLGIARCVRFTGAISHDQVPDLLREADIAVAPYPQLEQFYFSPIKLAEYMACGLAVVASACGDHAAWLEDGSSALLVPPGDVGALVAALERLATDAPLRRRLGQRARRLAVERFSLEEASARLEGLLGELVTAARQEVAL